MPISESTQNTCKGFLSLQNGLSVWFTIGDTITGKTADLTVFQKTIIDTLHKEGKPQTFIAKEADCSHSAVSKHVNRKLSGRKKCGRKRCTTNRENCSLMRIVKQNRFKNLGELHKEWTEAGVKASRATTHRRVKEFGYRCHQRRLTWAKEMKNWTVAQWSKVLFKLIKSNNNDFYIVTKRFYLKKVPLNFWFIQNSWKVKLREKNNNVSQLAKEKKH